MKLTRMHKLITVHHRRCGADDEALLYFSHTVSSTRSRRREKFAWPQQAIEQRARVRHSALQETRYNARCQAKMQRISAVIG